MYISYIRKENFKFSDTKIFRFIESYDSVEKYVSM